MRTQRVVCRTISEDAPRGADSSIPARVGVRRRRQQWVPPPRWSTSRRPHGWSWAPVVFPPLDSPWRRLVPSTAAACCSLLQMLIESALDRTGIRMGGQLVVDGLRHRAKLSPTRLLRPHYPTTDGNCVFLTDSLLLLVDKAGTRNVYFLDSGVVTLGARRGGPAMVQRR